MKKLFFLIMISFLSITLFGQKFSFRELNNPLPSVDLEFVKLFSSDEAFIGNATCQMYYDGLSVRLLSDNSLAKTIFSFPAAEFDVYTYAFCLAGKRIFYRWSKIEEAYQMIDKRYPDFYTDHSLLAVVVLDARLYLIKTEDLLMFFKYDGLKLDLLKELVIQPNQKLDFEGFYLRPRDVLITVCDPDNSSTKVLSYDYDNTIIELETIPADLKTGLAFEDPDGFKACLGTICTFDSENFYFFSNSKIVKWNSISRTRETIYHGIFHFNQGSFMISADEIILYGSGGIAKLTISAKQFEFLYLGSYEYASYSSSLKKAIFISSDNRIIEMLWPKSDPAE